jgi:hypothetical protein
VETGLGVWQAFGTGDLVAFGVTLDTALIGRLRAVVRGAPTTESELRRLWDEAYGWRRALQAQIAAYTAVCRVVGHDPLYARQTGGERQGRTHGTELGPGSAAGHDLPGAHAETDAELESARGWTAPSS